MPLENPELSTVAISTAGGLVGGAVVALSKPMSRREVFYCLIGGVGLGSFVSPALVAYFNLTWQVAGGIGFVGGVSVVGLIPALQAASNWFVKSKFGGNDSPGGKS